MLNETKDVPRPIPPRVTVRAAHLASRALTVGAYVLIVTAVGLAWSGRGGRASIGATLQAASRNVRQSGMAGGARSASTVYFVFQKEDCVDVLNTAAIWNALSASGRVAVVGVLVDPPSDSAGIAEIVRGAGLKFPVAPAKGRLIVESINRLGFNQTPVAIFVDEQGRLLLAAPGAARGAANVVRSILSGSGQ